jgi:hypothetical protein
MWSERIKSVKALCWTMAHSQSGALGRQPIGLRIMIGLIAGWITRQRGQLYRMKYLATKMRKILLYLNGHMGSEVRQFGICMNL